MLVWPSRALSDNPNHMLLQYALGRMPDWVNGSDGEVAWIKREHRGIQWLDKIQLPKKSQHRKYILEPKFTIKFNTAFDQVLRACADLAREDAEPAEGRVKRWEKRLSPWAEQRRTFRSEGFYERFPAKGQVERVARIHRELARAVGLRTGKKDEE